VKRHAQHPRNRRSLIVDLRRAVTPAFAVVALAAIVLPGVAPSNDLPVTVSLGVVVVNSAGNSGPNSAHNTLGAPADGHAVIAAGAVDAAGARASFSSVGPTADGRIKPDVAAQGVAVKVASPTSPTQYGLANGTSFSCPLTAGVAALVLQAHPEYTPGQVANALRTTASRAASPDNLLGYGIVDALAAVRAQPRGPDDDPGYDY